MARKDFQEIQIGVSPALYFRGSGQAPDIQAHGQEPDQTGQDPGAEGGGQVLYLEDSLKEFFLGSSKEEGVRCVRPWRRNCRDPFFQALYRNCSSKGFINLRSFLKEPQESLLPLPPILFPFPPY